MNINPPNWFTFPVGGLVLIFCTCLSGQDTAKEAERTAPFGGQADLDDAKQLWESLKQARLVGEQRIQAFPYEGGQPHGKLLETFKMELTVSGRTAQVWVKNNYGGENLTKAGVLSEPDKHLGAVTVMFKREEGYDAKNQNWFWVKYLPDGSLDKSPDGVPLAGRTAGCIECHSKAPGGNMLFSLGPPKESP